MAEFLWRHYAPWTQEEVKRLDEYLAANPDHPYLCPHCEKRRELYPTKEGLFHGCGYVLFYCFGPHIKMTAEDTTKPVLEGPATLEYRRDKLRKWAPDCEVEAVTKGHIEFGRDVAKRRGWWQARFVNHEGEELFIYEHEGFWVPPGGDPRPSASQRRLLSDEEKALLEAHRKTYPSRKRKRKTKRKKR